jgi:hypothetical protein
MNLLRTVLGAGRKENLGAAEAAVVNLLEALKADMYTKQNVRACTLDDVGILAKNSLQALTCCIQQYRQVVELLW